MPRVEARQKRRDQGEAEAIASRPRQGRGEASKRRGEAEAALLLPRRETSAWRHKSLIILKELCSS